MYKLNLFKRTVHRLSDDVHFGRLASVDVAGRSVAVCINKDGSLQATWRYRGPDLDSSVEEELAVMTDRLQGAVAAMKTNYVLYFEAQRTPSTAYASTEYFPDPVTRGMDAERCKLFSSGIYFESRFYATLYCLPPRDRQEQLKAFIVEGREKKITKADDVLAGFAEQLYKLFIMFRNLHIEVDPLDEDALLTYLHSTVSGRPRPLRAPKTPMLLDRCLYDTPFYGGLEPQLGNQHMRVIAPISYGKETIFGLLDEFNRLDFAFRWVTRAYCMSKNDVLGELDTERRHWKGKLQSITSTLADAAIREGAQNAENIDDLAVDRIAEIRDAINAVEGDHISFVYYSTAVVVLDADRETVDEKAKLIRQIFIERGIKAKIEDFNAVDTWFSCIPGLVGRNIRRPLISTGNLIHMMPLALAWSGEDWNRHLDGPPLLYAQTDGASPYRLNLHVGEIGHSLMIGPTGAGKSVHLNVIEAAFRKYKNARVIIFDKGASSKVLTMGVGGKFYDIGKSQSLSFQPLVHIDDEDERQWAQEWLTDFLREEGIEVTPERKSLIRDSLTTVAGMEPGFRTMTTFISFLQSRKLKEAFYPMALSDDNGNKGEYGEIFDSDEDHLSITSWQSFEMETLMNAKRIVGTTLMYIFHRIENVVKSVKSAESGPTLIVLDECWVFFENPMFADKIKEWLKTLRKYNTSVLFATQSLDDIAKSPILDTVLSSCLSRIFLPDKLAITESRKDLYHAFGLNRQQIQLLAHATPQREYYYDSPRGSRLYNLALDRCPFTLSYVSVNKSALARCQRILDEYGEEAFNEHWIAENDLILPDYPKEEAIAL
ncbi:TraG/VirB4 family ATPase [Mitsuokella sp. oral taxon 131]|uniref:TraG/VirB4 family ATPase n=1 Tax=Mitsuokella sp. oral taxon 131 TaxID=1321780 RepID=UPI0003ADE520|nr:ATP-binding protein [Mitsuokella sp. oral taxon 131]ERL03194.1 type IV secretion/conjugal transfer ATPase, VirB4 family [Mitsuokella sp. oral taxon 131 str. W9106]